MFSEIMEDTTKDLLSQAQAVINLAASQEDLENIRIGFLGRNGKMNELMAGLLHVSPAQRGELGRVLNQAKREIELLLSKKEEDLLSASSNLYFDPTEPSIKPNLGHLHLITYAAREIMDIFERIGFVRVRHPEIDSDYYAFEALNMPAGHPARDEWETFYIADNLVITPHTSNGQVREMEKGYLPIKMINIARCGRRQSDVSHSQTFHQFEGLYIDKGVSIANLKGVLEYFARNFYGSGRQTRLRPYDFRFTEPSFEVDVTCGLCGGSGCSFCKGGWLELGGAGMVHPKVLRAGGIDPRKYSGFAFGWGVERTYMMKAELSIPDIRILYKNDLNFLEQF